MNNNAPVRFTRIALVLATLALLTPAQSGANSAALQIRVLSGRADLITGGEALVEVVLPRSVRASNVRVFAGSREITSEFAIRPNGRFMGIVRGLALGRNMLTATIRNGMGAVIPITNALQGGPSLSGPHVEPWVCQVGALDKDCNAPTKYEFLLPKILRRLCLMIKQGLFRSQGVHCLRMLFGSIILSWSGSPDIQKHHSPLPNFISN